MSKDTKKVHVSPAKKKAVADLVEQITHHKTLLLASTRGLPGSQFHAIKKKFRGVAEIRVAKKSLVIRAISQVEKGSLQNIKEKIGADVALFFSNEDPFMLSSKLSESLITKQLIFDFATFYRNKNSSIGDAKTFKLNENDFKEFKSEQ
jgi:ribosomal protein L10